LLASIAVSVLIAGLFPRSTGEAEAG